MRAVFGLAGLLVVMAIVGVLMKNNLSATRSTGTTAPVAVDGVKVPQVDATKNVRDQSQQIQKQVRDTRQTVEAQVLKNEQEMASSQQELKTQRNTLFSLARCSQGKSKRWTGS